MMANEVPVCRLTNSNLERIEESIDVVRVVHVFGSTGYELIRTTAHHINTRFENCVGGLGCEFDGLISIECHASIFDEGRLDTFYKVLAIKVQLSSRIKIEIWVVVDPADKKNALFTTQDK